MREGDRGGRERGMGEGGGEGEQREKERERQGRSSHNLSTFTPTMSPSLRKMGEFLMLTLVFPPPRPFFFPLLLPLVCVRTAQKKVGNIEQ